MEDWILEVGFVVLNEMEFFFVGEGETGNDGVTAVGVCIVVDIGIYIFMGCEVN